jgi:predicted AAA+ superfamily ATPase
MSFFEFLEAIDKGSLWSSILSSSHEKTVIPKAFHQELSELLKVYFIVGGMPEALADYQTHENFDRVREIQNEILSSYKNDFHKYSDSPSESLKISSVWQAIPSSLSRESKKFSYALIGKTARGRDYAIALEWLSDARLIHRSFSVEKPDHPLGAYKNENKFKCFFLDVGLLGATLELQPKVVLENDKIFTEFKGALTENFVAQELIVSGQKNLFYWESERLAEIDFLVSIDEKSIPIEVKSGTSKGIQSLRVYDDKFHPTHFCRLSPQNIHFDGKFINLPLYGTSLLKKFL